MTYNAPKSMHTVVITGLTQKQADVLNEMNEEELERYMSNLITRDLSETPGRDRPESTSSNTET